ncbi:MAG: efflux RND transporter periplasmic adaptor subunit [Nevskiaceae bacterium]|nr:MAG: efflux RND transporter periplasmic adaptor subunit [Nevskiaceae bacterium]
MRHLLLPLLCVLTLAACGESESDAPTVTTVAVERGDVAAAVTAGGTLQALVTVQVGSQVSGRIASLEADYNSIVKKGDVVARIDPLQQQAAVRRTEANVAAAKGNLAKSQAAQVDAERQLRRARELLPQGYVSQAEIDTLATALEQAQAEVAAQRGALAQAQAAYSEALVNLDYTVIRSPTDGMVVTRSVDVGQTVAASLQAPVLFTIAQDLKKMQVHTSVAESDVGQLKEGMAAEFSVDAYPTRKFQGQVSQVRVSPTTMQNVVTYDAVVDVENPALELKPGMTANVSFRTAEAKDVLKVANAALRFKPPQAWQDAARAASETVGAAAPAASNGGNGNGGERPRDPAIKRVWKQGAKGATPEPVPVRVGVSDGAVSEITPLHEGALAAGDLLVTGASGVDGAAGGKSSSMAPPGLF